MLSLGNRFRMENANTDHGGHVGYLIGRIVSARWTNVATSGRYFFQVQQSGVKLGKTLGAYYFQVTDIGP